MATDDPDSERRSGTLGDGQGKGDLWGDPVTTSTDAYLTEGAGTAAIPERPKGRRSMASRLNANNVLTKLLSLVLLLAVWQALSSYLGAFLMPGPLEVGNRLVNIVMYENFASHLGDTLYRVIIGLILSMFVAVAVGVPMGLFRFAERFFEGYVLLGLTIPGLAWALIAVMVLGLNNWAPILAIVVSTTPMIILNLWQGTKSIDREILQMGSAFRASKRLTIRHIVIPQVTPFVLAGLRLGFALAWKIVVLSEMFGLNTGVGYSLNRNFSQFSLAGVMGWTIGFSIVMAGFEFAIFRPIERHVTRWRPSIQAV